MRPNQMKAFEVKNKALFLTERPVPKVSEGEVLIRVFAAGINRPDILQRQGLYPPPDGITDIPGLEVAGKIVQSKSARWSEGDKVCALLAGGGYADFAVARGGHCLPCPDSLSYVQAAAIPETFWTVWHNLFYLNKLLPGQSALIHGGSSGIGTAAIQIITAMGGKVYITAGSDKKCDACLNLGAKGAINYNKEDFVEALFNQCNKDGVDFVLDIMGGGYIERNLKCLKYVGTHISIAFLGGTKGVLQIPDVMRKALTLTGSTLRSQKNEVKSVIARQLEDTIWPYLEKEAIAPVIDSNFHFEEAPAAHERMESREHIGKIVLTLKGDRL